MRDKFTLMKGLLKIEHRTSNIERPTSNNVFCLFRNPEHDYFARFATKAESKSTAKFDSSESGSESFHLELTSEWLKAKQIVAVCGFHILKSIKRIVIHIRRSMLDVRCSTFACL